MEEREKILSEWEAQNEKIKEEFWKEFPKWKKIKKNFPGKIAVILGYCDECGGISSTLEHGGLFQNLKHIIVSYH